jgi:hypothetical protein
MPPSFGVELFDGADETIPAAMQRFHEARALGVVSNRGAETFDRRV